MTKQCPSCGGDCGRTKKSGCQYNTPNPKFPDKFEVCDTSELSRVLKDGERAAVLKLVQKLSKVIRTERPIIVAQACLMLIKLSTDLEGVK